MTASPIRPVCLLTVKSCKVAAKKSYTQFLFAPLDLKTILSYLNISLRLRGKQIVTI